MILYVLYNIFVTVFDRIFVAFLSKMCYNIICDNTQKVIKRIGKNMDINKTLAEEFKLRQEQIDNTVALLDDDKTIPFIARYRKELTGSLDDQVLREIADRLTYLRNLEKRKGEIISSITEQEKMTDEIMSAIENAKTLVEVEDIYRPFKPKRKTRASVAREKGLEPLAELILTQDKKCDPQVEGVKIYQRGKGRKVCGRSFAGCNGHNRRGYL